MCFNHYPFMKDNQLQQRTSENLIFPDPRGEVSYNDSARHRIANKLVEEMLARNPPARGSATQLSRALWLKDADDIFQRRPSRKECKNVDSTVNDDVGKVHGKRSTMAFLGGVFHHVRPFLITRP